MLLQKKNHHNVFKKTLITGPHSSLGHINVKNECLGIATLLHCIKASKFEGHLMVIRMFKK